MIGTAAVNPPAAIGGTLKMSDEVFERVRAFIYERTGIYFRDNKKYLLESRLGRRVLALHLERYDDYLRLLAGGPRAEEERRFFYDAVTINETYFFRNEPQLEVLDTVVIPALAAAKRGSPRPKVRVWSAAASSGEEAYTIAMLFCEKLKPKFPTLDLEIVGTDINHTVIETARKGIYREHSVRNTPKQYLSKYFVTDGARYEIRSDLKALARFETLNLNDRPAIRRMGAFDIILCCNVLIYFDTDSKTNVVAGLYEALARGGYLFLGAAEPLHGISTAFKVLVYPKTLAYRKE